MQVAGLFAVISSLVMPRLCAAAVADAGSITVSTMATLPPPAPSGNAPCTFENVTELVERVVEEWAGSNVSLLVQTCPGVCDLVYGTGNPDISGIGAMSSYAIQGVSSLLLGPVLGMLVLYAGRNPHSDSFLELPSKGTWAEVFAPVTRSIHGTNIIVAFSVLFAALVRLGQVSPVAERSFLRHLAGYEVLVAVVCVLSYLPMHESSRLKKMVMCCYVLGTIVMVFVAMDWTNLGTEPYASTYEAITRYCVQLDDWPVPDISFSPPAELDLPSTVTETAPVEPGFLVWMLIFSPLWILPFIIVVVQYCPWLLCPFILILFVAGGLFFLAALVAYIGFMIALFSVALATAIPVGIVWMAVRLSTGPYLATCQRLRLGPMRLGAILIAATFATVGAALVSIILRTMSIQRQRLRAASGDAYRDDDWGFGQITALLMWIPAAQDMLFAVRAEAIRYYRAQAPRTRHWQDSHKHERLSLLEKPDSELPSEDELSPATSQPPESRRYRPPTNGTSAGAYHDDQRPVHKSSPVVQENSRSGLPPPSIGLTSSVDVKLGTVQARPTWPRNEKGTYLPA